MSFECERQFKGTYSKGFNLFVVEFNSTKASWFSYLLDLLKMQQLRGKTSDIQVACTTQSNTVADWGHHLMAVVPPDCRSIDQQKLSRSDQGVKELKFQRGLKISRPSVTIFVTFFVFKHRHCAAGPVTGGEKSCCLYVVTYYNLNKLLWPY